MSESMHPRMRATGDLALGLAELARCLIVAGINQLPKAPRPKRGGTIRPGPKTPLWNALAQTVRPHLRRWGAKTNLGRMFGVPPQRVHEYFRANSAAPDAERVLQILVWLARGAPKLVGPARRRRWWKRPRPDSQN